MPHLLKHRGVLLHALQRGARGEGVQGAGVEVGVRTLRLQQARPPHRVRPRILLHQPAQRHLELPTLCCCRPCAALPLC